MEYTLKNILTTEERLKVTKLIGHDSETILFHAQNNLRDFKNIELASGLIWASRNIGATVELLTQYEKINLVDNYDQTIFENKGGFSLKYFMNELEKIHKGKLKTYVADSREFLACKPVLYTVLLNLIKNGIEAQSELDNPTLVLRSEYHQGFPEKALFIPEGAKDYKNFMAFHVQNQGDSFPKNPPLIERLTKICPKIGSRGFGLYFTGLASKFLRAPINIISNQELTTVSIYHPIYVE